jgi:nucleoside-diphosphate-sugar epimerase
MRVLVSGANGFLGQKVVEQLLKRGHSVRALIRPTSTEPAEWRNKVEIFRADLRVHDNLVSAFADVDSVIHAAAAVSGNEDIQFASTVVATERFLEAMAQSSVKRFLHVSTLAAYSWAGAKGTMDENTPLEDDIYGMGAYTIAKVWQERLVSRYAVAHGWELTIMRPGFIWGPGHAAIAGMGRRFRRIYLLFGPLTRLPLSHVVNCADCLVAAIESPLAIGRNFNVIDGDDIRVWRYVREYAARTGQRGLLILVPYRVGLVIANLASLMSRMLFGKKGKMPSLLVPRRFQSQFRPLRFSNQRARDLLKWHPPLNFEECLNLTYRPATTKKSSTA